ncbi:MAG: hypothetical protein Q4B34_00230 [Candidatus Saccharibacteria bacterium]|nr:hypothetical protein [Candidatus Saccharibacteria bacterium]
MALEINLVPDIKNEMIKALKLRNLIFFICIVVASASIIVSIILASAAAIQQSAADGKRNTIDLMSSTVNSYGELSEFLTIRDQLGNLAEISDNKQLLSRIFGVLSALLPTGLDTITISELSISFAEDNPTISFDAQANAGAEPYIDYNVLDSFKKSMQYMRYDYGAYVDRDGNTIPAYCIVESFSDETRGSYAYWLINGEGCNPSAAETAEEETNPAEDENETTEGETVETPEATEEETAVVSGYATEQYEGQTVVRIWRTPQYEEWYKAGYLSLDGTIENVAHFESDCITYTGTEVAGNVINWTSSNDSCLLVPDGTEGITIAESSNGRDTDEQLVLRFSATIVLSPEVFSFNNKHLLSLSPTGRHNVTDSYLQLQDMFAERAEDCAEGDTTCNNNANTGGNNG